ncbi:MAG: toprim domain-containing protein, partial [Chlamydiota bacterium]|nr:toprim domain-containing protein [Chlamydiota bacterium]
LDALRLIQEGFDYAVASQGTSFTDDQVKALIATGMKKVVIAFDGDRPGIEAAIKTGGRFQKEGIEVNVLTMAKGSDPDTLLREEGPEAFHQLIEAAKGYLPFLLHEESVNIDLQVPAQKHQLVERMRQHIESWKVPLLIEESLRQLAKLIGINPEILGIGVAKRSPLPSRYIRQKEQVKGVSVDPDWIMETDILRWLYLGEGVDCILNHFHPHQFHHPKCRQYFIHYQRREERGECWKENGDPHYELLMETIHQKKVNLEQVEEGIKASVLSILEREWMRDQADLQREVNQAVLQDDNNKIDELMKKFSLIVENPPKL